MKWEELVGKKIVAFRGYDQADLFGTDKCDLAFILFDDQETYLELSEQDKYDYHDCNSSARVLCLRKDAKEWKKMFEKKEGFAEPDRLGYDPF